VKRKSHTRSWLTLRPVARLLRHPQGRARSGPQRRHGRVRARLSPQNPKNGHDTVGGDGTAKPGEDNGRDSASGPGIVT
jgi:hypothetical protein